MSELIARALADATDTRQVLIGRGVVGRVADAFREVFGDRAAVVVGDERTMAAAGRAVHDALAAAGVRVLEPWVFPGEPELYARYENAALLRDAVRDLDAVVVAVGAGTLNDLAKRACGELGRPYAVVGTAASMDGYTAFGASLAVDGYKQTLDGAAPALAVADLDVMAAAPAAMTASGYGDLLGKLTAGADWLVADAVGAEAVDAGVWELVQGPLRAALSRPAALAAGDVDAVGGLAEGLLMSGLAMQAHHGSRPASGSEHLFSHLWEMEGLGVDVVPRRLSHGFKVAVGTVAVTALYEALLADDLASLDVDAAVAAWPSAEAMERRVLSHHTRPGLREAAVQQTMAKYTDARGVGRRLEAFAAAWPTLSQRLREHLVPAAELQVMLRAAGAPAHPADIGLGWAEFRATYARSQLIRSRYTILDTLAEAGLLEPLVGRLFAAEGFWGRQALA
ncbi:MAG: sn-glycerol-1-phosphate dehydrogenase [Propionicimonas sp.]|uniref:sn-glycerol-1-phosphate dehydrogenase n=1 Tax=Propionicimonas sp. TaxID=1955623 RepID=UPI003D144E4B